MIDPTAGTETGWMEEIAFDLCGHDVIAEPDHFDPACDCCKRNLNGLAEVARRVRADDAAIVKPYLDALEDGQAAFIVVLDDEGDYVARDVRRNGLLNHAKTASEAVHRIEDDQAMYDQLAAEAIDIPREEGSSR